ncbi:hypothetical protein LAZ29_06945 [Cereibacter sphaeroides]|uniref:hypothetical protein n=1 Tax=Cereibacter sphaeroides TaxID=1063 RepID=UPI001F44ED0E|nr:hypothetical protein [Cereibacter sphaeroides]MCE6950661.1 hypothetical protein [Cereibacter sphaeroides]
MWRKTKVSGPRNLRLARLRIDRKRHDDDAERAARHDRLRWRPAAKASTGGARADSILIARDPSVHLRHARFNT